MSLFIHDQMEQGSPEWHDARRGIVTASTVGKLLTVGPADPLTVDCHKCSAITGHPCLSIAKGKAATPIKTVHDARTSAVADLPPVVTVADNETSRALTATLVAERVAGWSEPSYMNDDMIRGVLHEPVARDRYAEVNEVAVEQVGFMVRDDWGFQIGASPDGLIGDDGGLEVKCPRSKTHIATILADEVPTQHMAQIQTSLLVSGRKWWDFVSFCAGLPMYTKRVEVDGAWQSAIMQAVSDFEEAAARRVKSFASKAARLPTTERIFDDLVVV